MEALKHDHEQMFLKEKKCRIFESEGLNCARAMQTAITIYLLSKLTRIEHSKSPLLSLDP